jgi:hypothetical protein
MRSLILFFGFMLCFSSAYGQFWKSSKSADAAGNTGNQVFNIGGTDEDEKSSNGSVANESEWNLDIEGLYFVMPAQPGEYQFVTGPIAIGTTYKFSEKMHLVYKYVHYKVDGIEDYRFTHDHHLAGVGFRTFFNQNEYQFSVSGGSGSSSVTEDNDRVKFNLDMPIWCDVSFFKVWDNVSMGLRFSFVDAPSTETDITKHIKGGYSGFGLVLQIGLPDEFGGF